MVRRGGETGRFGGSGLETDLAEEPGMGNTGHQVRACLRVAAGVVFLGWAGSTASADEVKAPVSIQPDAPASLAPVTVKTAGSTVEIFRQSDGHLGAGVQIEP